MHPRPPLPPGPFLVVGLARSGAAAALALRARGEVVLGVDAGAPDVGRLRAAGVEVQLEAPGTELVERAGALIKSPGVPAEAPAVAAARQRGVPVLGELELAWRLIPNPFVAITGTNGKTTTTELLGHVHRTAGVPVAVAGNVGTAVASLAGAVAPDTVVVCEASSFQLEDTVAFAPEAAALLNLEEDHLDRHGTMEAYRAAKLQAFARQEAADVAVLPEGFPEPVPGAARRIRFGEAPETAMRLHGGRLWWKEHPLVGVEELALRGPHNVRNAMAAAALALARGLDPGGVAAGLRSFPGVPHRLEEVAERDGVAYVNDSKATNVASTLVALASFPRRIHLIAGGRGKGSSYAALREPVAERCAAVYLIGEAAGELAAVLEGAGPPVRRCGDLEHAVAAARAAAAPGEVVLLSPACTSFDQYRDYEARGDHFRALARA